MLQTVTGLGSVVSTTWIPNLGVAACFGRSKVIYVNCTFNVLYVLLPFICVFLSLFLLNKITINILRFVILT